MARVDLHCGCGHKFFVGEAQIKAPGGVTCPACLLPLNAPAGRLPSKAATRGPESSTAKLLAAVVQPVVALPPPKKKLIVVIGVAAALILGVVVTLVLVLKSPSVDYDKQAQEAADARKRKVEQLQMDSKTEGPAAVPAPAPAKPGPTPQPAKPTAGSTEYKPLSSSVTPSPTPSATPAKPPTPEGAPVDPSSVAMSPNIVGRLRSEVLELPPFYLNLVLTPAEKSHLSGVAASGRGTPEDASFVEALLSGGKLKAVRDEITLITLTLPTLERESQENLPVDRITYVDGGRVLNCKILDEGAEVVKVSRALASGVGGQMPIRRDAIRIEKGKGIGTEFATRWEAARKAAVPAQVELLSWCKENTLTGQVKLVAYTILRADPSNTLARGEAGLPADPVKNAEGLAKGELIPYQGKNWNPKQLREKFITDGYALLDGKWYSKKDKMITVPGLFAYERQKDKPVNITGGLGFCHETETTYKKILDPSSGQMTEQPELKLLRRFYSPEMKTALTPHIPPGIVAPPTTADLEIRVLVDVGVPVPGTKMQGEVLINVPVGGILLEASVITTAEVKGGGSIVVYLQSPTAGRTKLYSCDPKENQSHVIPPELVRGSTEVNLVAVIEQIAAYNPKTERRHVRNAVMRNNTKIVQSPGVDIIHYQQIPDWKAMLFPSNSNTIEVFRLRASIAEAAPHIDKVFASNPDALK